MDFGRGDMTAVMTGAAITGVQIDRAWLDELQPSTILEPMPKPLIEGAILFNKSQLDVQMLDPSVPIREFAAKIDTYKAEAEAFNHTLDAYRYAMESLAGKFTLPAPPVTPPGLTPEQHAAHLAIHDLVSVGEFEVLREEPGFVQINEHWGAIGKQRFCCERPVPIPTGQRGYTRAGMYFNSVQLNAGWMAKIEHSDDGITWTPIAPEDFMPPKEKRPWWSRFLTWIADKVF